MFEKSFTLTVSTDSEGHFHSAQPVTSPFSLDVKITANLQSPAGTTIHASFELAPTEGPPGRECPFTITAGESVDLGKWRVIAGDDANVATAAGYTEPVAANIDVIVEFVAAPSFF
jgi:hypothetical protein